VQILTGIAPRQRMREKPLSSFLAGSCMYQNEMICLNSDMSKHQKVLLQPREKTNSALILGNIKK